jgi:hypothetical protein
MFIEKEYLEGWMQRIMDRFDRLENKMEKPDEKKVRGLVVDGERLFDGQDMCLLLNVCKRTVQRYRTLGWLPYLRIDQKAYYRESDVKKFIEERARK